MHQPLQGARRQTEDERSRHLPPQVDALQIVTLPAPIAGLSEVERDAIMEVIGVAEDLSLRGDDRAAVALGWMRSLLSSG